MVIFFLIVTTVAVRKGILRVLPQLFLENIQTLAVLLLNVGAETKTHWLYGLLPAVWASLVVFTSSRAVFVWSRCEIVPAFRGIGWKVVPGAVPAIDRPVVPSCAKRCKIDWIPVSPGGIVGLFILDSSTPASWALHWFCPALLSLSGATAGVFCKRWGGLKGCVFEASCTGYWHLPPCNLYAGYGSGTSLTVHSLMQISPDGNRLEISLRLFRALVC